jgi:hypothetical protein
LFVELQEFMDKIPHVVNLALEQAVTGFSALVASTLEEAALLLNQAHKSASGDEQRIITTSRLFLIEQGRALRGCMETQFAAYLERAMLTMHKDLRADLRAISADSMSLIDDEVVIRQIEVDRLVTRLRDVEELALGRITLIIAQLHGASEVRERENPFRPYLLARALHEGLRELVRNEAQSKLLFDYVSIAMASNLPGYYAASLDIFESRGISAQLRARPAAVTRAERERDGWNRAALQLVGEHKPGQALMDDPAHEMRAKMLPRLQNLLGGQQGHAHARGHDAQSAGHGEVRAFPTGAQFDSVSATSMPARPQWGQAAPHWDPAANQQSGQASLGFGGPPSILGEQRNDLQDLVWNVFNQSKGARRMRTAVAAGEPELRLPLPRVSPLDMQLRQLQQAAAAPEDNDEAAQPLMLPEQLSNVADDGAERVTIDLVGLLFECFNYDEQVPPALRKQLGRLHIPFLRAALLDSSLLNDADHPARRLLDQIGTLCAGMTPGTPGAEVTEAVIKRVLDKVLAHFDNDPEVFVSGSIELDSVVAPLLRSSVESILLCAEAIEEAETISTRNAVSADALAEQLLPLKADPRVAQFVTEHWSRVLVHGGEAYAALLPELLWSAQEKSNPEDRAMLMKLLPKLVGQVREGLALLKLSPASSKAALDQMVAVHMDVLSNKQVVHGAEKTLAELQAHFTAAGARAMNIEHPARIDRDELEAALSRRQVSALLHTEPANLELVREDDDWLMWARPGAGFELKIEITFLPLQLIAVSPHGSAFLFSQPDQSEPLIFTKPALIKAMRDGVIRTLEHAPLFDRALESLIAGAESLPA